MKTITRSHQGRAHVEVLLTANEDIYIPIFVAGRGVANRALNLLANQTVDVYYAMEHFDVVQAGLKKEADAPGAGGIQGDVAKIPMWSLATNIPASTYYTLPYNITALRIKAGANGARVIVSGDL